MSIPVRIEIPAAEGVGGSVPAKWRPTSRPCQMKLDLAQAHGIAVQLEEQGFGYGAFWCKPPTVREALWILWSAIRGKEVQKFKPPSGAAKAPSMVPWLHADDPYDPWTGEWKAEEPPADQEQPPPPPPPPPKKSKGFTE